MVPISLYSVDVGAVSSSSAIGPLREIRLRCPPLRQQAASQPRTLHAAASHLALQGWTDVAAVSVPAIGQYLLRGVSTRLAKQRQHRLQTSAQASDDRPDPEADDAQMHEGADVCVPSALSTTVDHRPSLLQCADSQSQPLPPFQYVLPVEAHRTLSRKHLHELFSLIDAPSFLLCVVSLSSPSAFCSFFPVYRGIYHVTPRALLSKSAGEADGAGATHQEEGGGSEPTRNFSNRAERKRKRAQDIAAFDAARRSAVPSPMQEPTSSPVPSLLASSSAPTAVLHPPPTSASSTLVAASILSTPTSTPAPRRERRARQVE